AKQALTPRGQARDKGMIYRNYNCSVKICRVCSLQTQCTKTATPRTIRRWEHASRIEKMTELLESKPDSMVIRQQTVEHPFGTIKLWMGATQLLTRRFKGVSIEMDLHVLAYNLRRMITIFGVSGLIKALMTNAS
ncbi:transposase, partial [Oleiphilus sp. HI0128]